MPFDIKLCGLTHPDDVRAAQALGADYLGFVLHARSPRGLTPEGLLRLLDAGEPVRNAVGVFVNMPPEAVDRLAARAGLAAVQLHGDERPEDYAGLVVPVWRALRVDATGARPLPGPWAAAARFVVDAQVPGQYGGTGVTADWDVAAGLARGHDVMLAGGLTAANVGAAIAAVRPGGVDVASGIESRPGRKDPVKMAAFVQAARAAAARP